MILGDYPRSDTWNSYLRYTDKSVLDIDLCSNTLTFESKRIPNIFKVKKWTTISLGICFFRNEGELQKMENKKDNVYF